MLEPPEYVPVFVTEPCTSISSPTSNGCGPIGGTPGILPAATVSCLSVRGVVVVAIVSGAVNVISVSSSTDAIIVVPPNLFR